VAELYADGKATAQELEDAYDAAYAASDDAYVAARVAAKAAQARMIAELGNPFK
jgi:hypothetical protein